MKKSASLILAALLVGSIVPPSMASSPNTLSCSLLTRNQSLPNDTLASAFDGDQEMAGAYFCFDQLTVVLQFYLKAYGPTQADGISFFRLSQVMEDNPPSEPGTFEPPEGLLLACFEQRRSCVPEDFRILVEGALPNDLLALREIWEQVLLQISNGELRLPRLHPGASDFDVSIYLDSTRDRANFFVSDDRNGEGGLVIYLGAPNLEVISVY